MTETLTSWHELVTRAMAKRDDSWSNLVGCTLTDTELHTVFDADYGLEEGKPFTLWTADYVYFPVSYDGKEWVGAVPRNPCDTPTHHFGG